MANKLNVEKIKSGIVEKTTYTKNQAMQVLADFLSNPQITCKPESLAYLYTNYNDTDRFVMVAVPLAKTRELQSVVDTLAILNGHNIDGLTLSKLLGTFQRLQVQYQWGENAP